MSEHPIACAAIACAATLAVASATARPLSLNDIFAPQIVATPPAAAVRDLCRTADGEIRHYGWQPDSNDRRRRVFIASRDNGLNWTLHPAAKDDPGAMTQSPWSGDWISIVWGAASTNCLIRSTNGPGRPGATSVPLPWIRQECRQIVALKSRRRWIACLSDIRCRKDKCYNAAVALSDDDGRTWRYIEIEPVPNVPRLHPGDKRPHWFNSGCEPSVIEHVDGTLELAVRTSGEHHCFYRSTDGGETWSAPVEKPEFWAANTMPLFFRLSGGRLLFFWNNTAILPTGPADRYPELTRHELNAIGETAFTNRDALHAAISDDDGKTWRGFREIALTGVRNAADFRELGNENPIQERDKSVHQTQALELPGGKVLLAYGQNDAARRILIFDPDWLLETTREEDFRTGLGNISNHLYVRSLSGGWRGWAGHCAWNRIPGALLVRDPDTDAPPPGQARSVREVLQLCRIRDPRLVSDRQGVAWNFPAARKGRVTLNCRIAGEGFRLTLADHWMNPCDEVGPRRSPLSVPVTAKDVPPGAWHDVVAEWDADAGTATVRCGDRTFLRQLFAVPSSAGVSYLHLQTLAEGNDPLGTYFRSFRKE